LISLTLSIAQVLLPAIRTKDSNQHPIAYLRSMEYNRKHCQIA
jgi:hypothetical protein